MADKTKGVGQGSGGEPVTRAPSKPPLSKRIPFLEWSGN